MFYKNTEHINIRLFFTSVYLLLIHEGLANLYSKFALFVWLTRLHVAPRRYYMFLPLLNFFCGIQFSEHHVFVTKDVSFCWGTLGADLTTNVSVWRATYNKIEYVQKVRTIFTDALHSYCGRILLWKNKNHTFKGRTIDVLTFLTT